MGVAGGGGGGALCPSCREHLAKRQVLEKRASSENPRGRPPRFESLKKKSRDEIRQIKRGPKSRDCKTDLRLSFPSLFPFSRFRSPSQNSHACHAKGKREEAGQLLSSLTVLLLPRKFYFFLDPNLSRRETAFLPPRPK